jgi:prophage antirepressor-like protein
MLLEISRLLAKGESDMPENQLQLFEYGTSPVRTLTIDGDPWFVARDVCNVFGLVNVARSLSRLPDEYRQHRTVNTLGGPQSVSVISEPGVYWLAFSSRKPQAEAFTNWVTQEVLPSIRKTGKYRLPTAETVPTTLADALLLEGHRQKKIEEAARLASLETERWNAPLDDTVDNDLDMHEGGNQNNGTI